MNGISLALQRGNPVLLAAAILVAVAVSFWAYRRTMPPLPPSSRRLLGILRFASFAILIGILFDPLVTFEKIETIRPNVVLLVDRSTSMGIVDGDDEGEQERRIDRAEELIGESGGGLKEKIRRRYGLSEHGFAVGLTDAAGAEGGDRTDLSLSLEEAIESEWERGVDGIVLVSDGIVNAGRDPVVVAEETGVPIFPVPVGDPDPVRDVALEQVLANPLVFVNSRVQVEVTLRGKGFAGEETPVRIFDGERVVAEETIRFTGKRESRTVSLGFPVHDEGIRRYTVRVPVADGERVEENNTLLFTVEAVKERLEVLLLSERPGWDFTFLKRSLDRDPNVHTACYIQSKDGSPRSVDGGAAPFPRTAEELYRYDLLIVQGIPAVLRGGWGDSLKRYIRDRGGALLMVIGERSDGTVPKELEEILPVLAAAGRLRIDEGPFEFRLTDAGEAHPMLRLHTDRSSSAGLWSELPPLTGAATIGPVRPGAQLLAAHPRLRVDGREVPVLALGAAGKGRVLLLNGAGSWRWDFRMWGVGRSNRVYERFWSNAVRWLVAREGYRNIVVKPENLTYDRGEAITFRGLVMDESLNPVARARVEVVIEGPGGEVGLFRLDPDPSEGGAYRRTVGPFPPGDYSYRAAVVQGEVPLGEEEGEFSVSEFCAEFLETERNDALLRSLAEVSGGRVLPAGEIAEWGGDLSLESRTRRIREEKEIWNHPAVFVILLLFLSTEWFLRKRWGLS